MSLINDALKKAQRLRAEAAASIDPADGSGGKRVEKRGQPLRAQTIVLLVACGAVLVVFSVVVTVYLLNRPSPAVAHPPVVAKPPMPAAEAPAPALVVSIPPPLPKPVEETPPPPATATTRAPETVSTPLAAAAPPAPAVQPPEKKPAGVAKADPSVTSPPLSPESTPPKPEVAAIRPTTATTRPTAPASDVRVQMFVDAIRVTGIRSSGNDSKVLMNDRVYRVNDIVDRALGVKLVKVEADKLSFTDPAGFTYTKNF